MIDQLRKITIVTSFSIFPPRNFHADRIFHLYRHLAENLRIEIISLTEASDDYFTGIIAPGLSEIRIPKSFAHQQAERELQQKLGSQENNGSLIELYKLTPQYLSALKKSADQAIAIICYQPYLFPAIRNVSNKPIWYEAAGIESELQATLLPETEIGIDLLQTIKQVEKQCCQDSDFIITASENIARQITNIYNISATKILYLPYGNNSQIQQFTSYEHRLLNKEKLGLEEGFLAIFMSARKYHDIDEIKIVLNIASKLKNVNFLILGHIGMKFNTRLISPNVSFISQLDSKLNSLILDTADIALNPVIKTTNAQPQMIEYFSRGIPVISTQLGINDFDFKENKYCLVGETWQFPGLLLKAKQEKIFNTKNRIRHGNNYVMEECKWKQISDKLLNFITEKNIAS